jgi:23S rRNA pseudouridine955/2504/2580 synthase
MADAGHPLVGDGKYGILRNDASTKANAYYSGNYQALYSYKLTFSFKTDAGILNYLKDRTFEVDSVPFSL